MYALTLAALLVQTAPQDDKSKSIQGPTINGNWTVVSYEKDGQPMTEAKDATVTIKDNTATFTPAAGADKGKMKAMRFSFGPNATIRVAEANADGKFDASAPQPAGAGAAAAAGGMKSGVYVLTQEYLAVCIHDDSARAGAGGTGEVRPAGGTAGAEPNAKTYCTVILKRGTR